MKNYKLVPMDRSHLHEIAQIERECFSTPWSERALEEELFNPLASFIVAQRADGAVLGYAGLHVVVDEGYVDNIAVREDYRGQGIADDLLDVFVRFGRSKLAFLTLEVRESNTPAIQLYMKHGFAQVGRRKDYYQAPKEDALIMTLEFQEEPHA
ncbi:ribosomal protein S18-alanine N-acetyltransferase [Pseudoflavonifractor phocaeensis]|uniref:ribosomal protein S18-alanine N-acetyltransferase n=1 Tax=Pseudoflavonifractor phocaeensis TaxID=1870988 RepID=UPI00308984FC|nr:ribosomal-protein-alanine acetyltransferase [Oscillospiraceae bacterium]